jgi:tetraacyldisaccharide 4'-kinase
MRQWLSARWYEAGARPALLAPPSLVYRALMRWRRRAYASGWVASERAGRPVVVIGNLTVGGTGKTPLTIWLARALSARGLQVGIVARGYGGRGSRPRQVRADSDWRDVGDEPLLLVRHSACTTVVARDRVAGARALVAGGAQVVLADDGLQHLRLARDCEIVVIDGARGFGNGQVLPAGPLREGREGLASPDAYVVNGPPVHASLRATPLEPAPFMMSLALEQAVALDARQAPRPLAAFAGTCVHAVAGIGNPARFFQELRARGLELIEHAFPDHHPFVARDLAFTEPLPVLMTEKDAVKCRAFADARLWYVPVRAQFGEREGQELLARVLSKVLP